MNFQYKRACLSFSSACGLFQRSTYLVRDFAGGAGGARLPHLRAHCKFHDIRSSECPRHVMAEVNFPNYPKSPAGIRSSEDGASPSS